MNLMLTIQAQVKIGIIGLDTSHLLNYQFINGDDKKEEYNDFIIVAAIPMI